MFQAIIEYHIPKLQRTELTNADGKPFVVKSVDSDGDL